MHVSSIHGAHRAVIAAAILVAMTAGIGQETTVGTVKAVDPLAREVTVIAGRGYALREIVFHLEPGNERLAAPSGVKPGAVVEVHHRKVGGRDVALSIEVLPSEPERGRP